MKHTIFLFLGNVLGVYIAHFFVDGFIVMPGIQNFLIVGGLLTLLNLFIKPIIRFFVFPLIILTLGLFSLVVNASILELLDFLSKELTINGLIPLAIATIVITIANLSAHIAAKQNS